MSGEGLFNSKHVAHFTLYSELCVTTWEKNYIRDANTTGGVST